MEKNKLNKWICSIRPANTWIFDDKEDRYFRPWMMFLLQASDGRMIDVHIFNEKPFPHEVFNQIFASIKKPINKNLVIKNPDVISFEDKQLASEIKEMLAMHGIDAVYGKPYALIEPIIEDFVKGIDAGGERIPGLLSVPKVTRKMAACLFEHAQFFYKSRPWEIIDDTYLLEIFLTKRVEPYFVYVLGAGEIEKGLTVFPSWEKHEDFLQHSDDAHWEPKGYHMFSFTSAPEVSFEDMDDAEQFNWPLPEPGIYPTPLYFTKSKLKRPNYEMILWYQAALRAIPQYLDQFVNKSGQVRLRDEETNEFTVETSEGTQEVRIHFYLDEMPDIPNVGLDAILDEEEPLPFFDRRGMEGDLNKLSLDYFGEEERERTPVQEAQDVMYDAWDTPQQKKRIALAKKALKISTDCADAYVLLAEEEADTPEESLRLYRKGMEAGKRALGEEFLNDPENVGYFWGILSTRPFMRAYHGYAMRLAQTGEDDLALDSFRELLRLNPNDNQGVRYTLLEFLIKRFRLAEAKELIEEHGGYGGGVDFSYSQLLLAIEEGATEKELQELLEMAIETNAFVPDFLVGKRRIPEFDFSAMVLGGKDEAAYYATRYVDSWRAIGGAIGWLKENAP